MSTATNSDESAVSSETEATVPPVDPSQVRIQPDSAAVSIAVREIVRAAADAAIQDHGYFTLAIPGGSILKMLVDDLYREVLFANLDITQQVWTTQTIVAYVNHKCVEMDDDKLATHAKARIQFLDQWIGTKVITLDGTSNGEAEATAYQQKLQQLVDSGMLQTTKTDSGEIPTFDLALIGVGDDGHIGSLYPGRSEVEDTSGAWILPVTMKKPPSITMTLPVMQSAKQVVVAACGVSEKYPQGKSDAMVRAISSPTETISTFPAVGLRTVATWILDEAAASKLPEVYQQQQ
jgi:6-phosphogluconolactonase